MLDTGRIRFVYFDLDDTLLDHRRAERNALADCCGRFDAAFKAHAIEDVQRIYHRHNVELWKAYAAGRITRVEVQHQRFSLLVDELGVTSLDSDELGQTYLEMYARHWSWLDGAEAAFQIIADRLPTGILTNGFSDIQNSKLQRFPILRDRSTAVVISEDVGYLKPDPRIFKHAADRVDAEPEELLYVGDSYHSDVRGGLGAGWQVAWLKGDDAHEPATFAFSDWRELTAILIEEGSTTDPVARERSEPPGARAQS